MNPFDWRKNYALKPTKFAADPHHRTPLYSKWCQTGMTVPWDKYRKAHDQEAKLERRTYGVPGPSITITAAETSRIPAIAQAKRSRA